MDAKHTPPSDDHILRAIFNAAVPDEALRDMGAVIVWNHLHATELAGSAFGRVGRARCGLFRWMGIDHIFDEHLRGRHDSVEIDFTDNASNTGKHIEITAGSIRMFLDHELDPDALVPKTKYGQTAALNNIGTLFEPITAHLPRAEHYLAILFHSKTRPGDFPCRLEVRFPDGDEGYACQHIRLYDQFPELLDSSQVESIYADIVTHQTVNEERVEDQAHPAIRKSSQAGA